MKTMKLSTKLATGFGLVIAIAILLGGMAVINMNSVRNIAESLNKENMPALAVANNVERTSLQTMYEMRGYAYTEDTAFLNKAETKLSAVLKFLDDAATLGASAADLAELKTAADQAKSAATEYGRVAKDTVEITSRLEKERVSAQKAATDYMTACNNWLKMQNTRLDAALARSADASEVKVIVQKINIANEIIDVGNAIIIGTWESQFRRSPEIFNKAKGLFSQVNAKLAELRALKPDAEETRLIDSCASAGQAYEQNMKTFLDGWLKREEMGKQRASLADKVLEAAQSSAEIQLKDTLSLTTAAATKLTTASWIMIIGLSIGTFLGMAIAYFITQSITKPVQAVANSLSEGSDQVASASAQISSASQSLAEGASEQAASLEETSASLEEISSMTKRNAENAINAKELANETRNAAEEGSTNMAEMNHAMADIQTSSDNIAKIIKTIDEIAFQTNILALNAAVEAARAGEAGMGFAVVADEVRNLAQRSAQAAKETAEKIEDSIRKSANGVQISAKVTSSLTQIVTKARQVDELVAEIATASREQSQGLEQVNTAVTQMDKVTQTNAASAEESASASEELNAQAATLREIVSELQLLIRGAGGRSFEPRHEPSTAHSYSPTKKSGDHRISNMRSSHRPALTHNRPALASPKKRTPQEEIPLEDSFKDF